ncbi:MAG: ABC-ATPase domain-containing protein, partial [Myxococcota bacterium]
MRSTFKRIDGKGYGAYKDARGSYDFDDYVLEIVHVQGDPFASPSRVAVTVPLAYVGLSDAEVDDDARRVGYEDALLRSFAQALRRIPSGRGRGSGKSGRWSIAEPGQEILDRTACVIDYGQVTVRFTAGLPAKGRRVLGRQAEAMFFDELPRVVSRGLGQADQAMMRAHANANEDQDRLRELLDEQGWLGFLADGAILPRRSGIDDLPLGADKAVAWRSPEGLKASVELPHAGQVSGMAIPRGVTLICGGGYHGKSTVLRALSHAVYNHIPGDGRELCSAVPDAIHVRAEDGRRICGVDISMFIDNLPDGRSTSCFHTDNASGSTSQAANITEALEMGSTCLLIDEDTSATNFMVRDRRMQELIAVEREPITPFVDRVAELASNFDVSTVLVVGGSGDYFDVADTVILMDGYIPHLVTDKARSIAAEHPSERLAEDRSPVRLPTHRIPMPKGFDPSRGRRAERVRAQRTRAIMFGEEEIDIALVAQLVDPGQARALGDWLLECAR